MYWYLKVLKKYADFNGRASRSEYWVFTLVNFVVSFALALIAYYINGDDTKGFISDCFSLTIIFAIPLFIPALAVTVRRLHDTDRSGLYFFLIFIPYIGAIALLIFFLLKGTQGDNRHGEDPLAQNNEKDEQLMPPGFVR